MVKIDGPTDYERLDALVQRVAQTHGIRLNVTGWTRKVYDACVEPGHVEPKVLVARLDSHATRSGEIEVFDERGMGFAQEIGAALEKEFGIAEASIRRHRGPAPG
jgi:hypothetical protein